MAIMREGKPMTARQQAAYVRSLTGWTREEYNKQYDILRNRARAYERGAGLARGTVNVSDLLARNARAQFYSRYYGEEYKPTGLHAAVQAAPAVSSGRKLTQTQRARIIDAQEARAYREMGGIINNSKYSEAIAAEVARLKELGAYSGRVLYLLARKYARQLDRERAEIRAYNKNVKDFASRMFFNS